MSHAASPPSAAADPAAPTAAPALVVLVRHADRGTAPADDPALSPAGEARARALADALSRAGITAIVTTQFRRTRDTARPLADRLGLQPEVVDTGAAGGHARQGADAVRRHPGGRVLVVGHSNTITAIAAQLGAPTLPELCETTFGLALVLVPGHDGQPTSLMTLHYGQPDPVPVEGCL